jgi:hypothetical protein
MYSFSGELTDTGHHLVVAEVREKLTRSKQAALTCYVNLISGSKVSQIKMSNRFAALENLNNSEGIKTLQRAPKRSAKESLALYELMQYKPWSEEECSRCLDRRKQAKMQWFQDPNQSNVGDLNNVRREASRYLRNKKKEYLKAKIDELETGMKVKNIRDLYKGISDLKRRVSSLDEKGDLVIDTHSILPRWRNHFFQLLNVELMMLGRQKKSTEEPLGSELGAIEVEMAIEKLKRHISPGVSQIPPELTC